MSSEPSQPRRSQALGPPLALLLLSLIWLGLRAPAIVQKDGSRDLAFARDIVTGTRLHGHGAWSGLGGLVQGTSWIDFLTLADFMGLGIGGIERVLTVLLAVVVAVSTLAFARILTELAPEPDAPKREDLVERARIPLAATVGGLVSLALLVFGVEIPLLWQPLLLPLPILLMHLCLWRLVRHGELVDALALAIFAALSFDVHVISVVVVWGAILAVPLAARRPLLATLGAAALGLATLVLSSPAVLLDHYDRLTRFGALEPVLAALLVPLVLGFALRRWFAGLAWPARLRLALLAELLALGAVVAAAQLDSTPEFGGRYLLPFLPAIGLGAALVTSWARARLGLALASLAALALLLASYPWLRRDLQNELPSNPSWVATDFDRVAARLDARGLTWTDAVLRLQAPGLVPLLSHLAVRLDPGEPEPPPPEAGLLLLAFTAAEAEAMLATLPASAVELIELDELRCLLIETSARADRQQVELCRDSSEDCQQVVLTTTDRVEQAHPSAWIDWRRALTAETWLQLRGRPAPRELLWRIPIGPGPAAVLGFPDVLPPRCAWRFVAAEGFDPGVELPARELELGPEASGTVLVSRSLEGERCESYGLFPPVVIETAPGWSALREALVSDW